MFHAIHLLEPATTFTEKDIHELFAEIFVLELHSLIEQIIKGRSGDDFVASVDGKKMLSYEYYLKMLKQYCEECGVTKVATHGLRHSTSEIYVAHGATRDDMYKLFKHSSIVVTERYMQVKGENVQKIAQVIRLFPAPVEGNKVERASGELGYV